MSSSTSSANESYVPDSSPGAVMSRGASGYGACSAPTSWARESASDQFAKPSDSGPKSEYRSLKLRHSTASFAGLVSTAMPSIPTFSSMNSMPSSSQAAISSASIGRDASDMSVSPAQKSSKPSPVPGPSTDIWTPPFSAENFSAFAAEIGSTVEDPETVIEPDSSGSWAPASVAVPSSSSPPQAAATRAIANAMTRTLAILKER